jgi:MFS family permease
MSDEAVPELSYFGKIRSFGWNARMYLLHIFGMDVIHGAWEVLFNLYLLQIGFDLKFIGLRLAVLGIAAALTSIPAGRLADRLDRKWGFIIGDGGGAVCAVILIMSTDGVTILAFSAIASAFGALHHVTEVPFMAENSEPKERIHLFSVGSGFRTLAAMFGALVAGFLPRMLVGDGMELVDAYRYAVYVGIGWWFISLIPAVLLRRNPIIEEEEEAATEEVRKGLFSAIKSPQTVFRFVAISAILGLGSGFVLRLANVFFLQDVHAEEHEIGAVFAVGSLFLAIGAFLAPFVVARLGEVASIFWTRLAAIPFILLIGYAPALATPEAVVSLAGLAWVLRTTLFNMSNPVMDSFSMGQLQPSERATFVGISSMFSSALAAVSAYLGASLMAGGDYRTPFIAMAVAYLISTYLFLRWFRGTEGLSDPTPVSN